MRELADVAVIVACVVERTPVVGISTCARVAPAGIRRVEGGSAELLLEVRRTNTPSIPAGAVSVTVSTGDAPPGAGLGESDKLPISPVCAPPRGWIVRRAERSLPAVAVIVAVVTAVTAEVPIEKPTELDPGVMRTETGGWADG